MNGFTLWFTGLPSSGKSTLAEAVEPLLTQVGWSVVRLDGDELRRTLCKGLGFKRADREENVRRAAFVARAVTHAGGVALVSVIAPYLSMRRESRREIGRYVEIYVECPLEVCIARDVKGLYRRAQERASSGMTGVDDPYEPPVDPELVVNTSELSVEQCLERIAEVLRRLGHLPRSVPV